MHLTVGVLTIQRSFSTSGNMLLYHDPSSSHVARDCAKLFNAELERQPDLVHTTLCRLVDVHLLFDERHLPTYHGDQGTVVDFSRKVDGACLTFLSRDERSLRSRVLLNSPDLLAAKEVLQNDKRIPTTSHCDTRQQVRPFKFNYSVSHAFFPIDVTLRPATQIYLVSFHVIIANSPLTSSHGVSLISLLSKKRAPSLYLFYLFTFDRTCVFASIKKSYKQSPQPGSLFFIFPNQDTHPSCPLICSKTHWEDENKT